MIKYLFFGLWICAVTLGSAYGAMIWSVQQESEAAQSKNDAEEIEQIKTRMITVPVFAEGALRGYVLAQFVFEISAAKTKEMGIKPDLFLVDEAFKVIYSGEAMDFRNLRKKDVAALSELIKKKVNARFGDDFVKEVLVQELNYMPQERLRGGALRGGRHLA
ncbi:MAG: hypothetical protein HC850_04390 [Rhodomicrobium sp.]|nr:hypothetical protein [Rhodomicrobium sp.]